MIRPSRRCNGGSVMTNPSWPGGPSPPGSTRWLTRPSAPCPSKRLDYQYNPNHAPAAEALP
jgi:hypothetical protein